MNPLELADYAAATGALLVGLAIGRRSRPRPPAPLRPVCSCDHGYGTHENGNVCSGEVKRAKRWDDWGSARAWEYAPCPCRRYDGPDPVIFGIEAQP